MQHPFADRQSKFTSAGKNLMGVGALMVAGSVGLFVQNGLKPVPDMAMQYLFYMVGWCGFVIFMMAAAFAMWGCLIQAIWSLDRGGVGSAYGSRPQGDPGYSKDGSGRGDRSDASGA